MRTDLLHGALFQLGLMCMESDLESSDDIHSLNDSPKLSRRLELLLLLLLPLSVSCWESGRKERKDYCCARAFQFKKASDTMGGKSEPFLYKLPLLKCLHDTQKKYFSMFAKHSCASAFNYMGAPNGETSFLLFLVFVQTSYNFRLTVLPLQRQNIVIGYVEQFQA